MSKLIEIGTYQNALKEQIMLLGLMLIALVFITMFARKLEGLTCYAWVSLLLVLIPVSGLFLSKYQTAFYRYEDIVCIVPVLEIVAIGLTFFATEWSQKLKSSPKILITCVIILFFSLVINSQGYNQKKDQFNDYDHLKRVLNELKLDDKKILASQDILVGLKANIPAIKLLYGRDMWQGELSGYTFDHYSLEERRIHASLEQCISLGTLYSDTVLFSMSDEGSLTVSDSMLNGGDIFKEAMKLGVGVIILPTGLDDSSIFKACEDAGLQCTRTDKFIILSKQETILD